MEKEELYRYYIEENHSRKDTATYFNIPENKLKNYLTILGIKKPKSLSMKTRYVPKLTRDEIYDYYIVENHTREECLAHFCLTLQVFKRYLRTYKIKKDKALVEKNIQKTIGATSPFALEEVKEKIKHDNIEKYGVEYRFQLKDFQDEIKQIMLDKYGVTNPGNIKEVRDTIVQTCIERYGVTNPGGLDWVQDKIKTTMIARHGTPNGFDLAKGRGSNSKPNAEFGTLLEDKNITHTREFHIEHFRYDFKLEDKDVLIEINPSITHNIDLSIFKNDPLDKNYHRDKSLTANNYGFRCIHVWDWDNKEAILNILIDRETTYARKCMLKEVSKEDAKSFLNQYHIQGYARDAIRLGLYYKDELVSIMTFDKPRYNKKYEYELVRYCSSYNVVGGAEKLFKHFLEMYSPKGVVSYCDLSKFTGDTYMKLGFTLENTSQPTCHWVNIRTMQHFTNNLVRQRGVDQLLGTNFGKGMSNEELLLNLGFVRVFDCGQATYVLHS